MAHITFSGPAELTPELLMAMWQAVPEENKPALAQLFFSQYARPVPEAVLASGVKVFFEKENLSAAAGKTIRDAVAKRCRELAGTMNEAQAKKVMDDAIGKAAAEAAKGRIDTLLAGIPDSEYLAAAEPGATSAVAGLAHKYFTQTTDGQQKIMSILNTVCQEEVEALKAQARQELHAFAQPVIKRQLRAADLSVSVGDNGS